MAGAVDGACTPAGRQAPIAQHRPLLLLSLPPPRTARRAPAPFGDIQHAMHTAHSTPCFGPDSTLPISFCHPPGSGSRSLLLARACAVPSQSSPPSFASSITPFLTSCAFIPLVVLACMLHRSLASTPPCRAGAPDLPLAPCYLPKSLPIPSQPQCQTPFSIPSLRPCTTPRCLLCLPS